MTIVQPGHSMRTRLSAWLVYGVPLLVTIALFLPRIPYTDFEVDTGLYAGLSWHMVQEGSWLSPLAGDQYYFNKPPLAFWFHAAGMWLTGPSLTSILLWQLVVACGVVAAWTLAATALSGRRVAMLAGMMVATTVTFFVSADRFILDYWILLFFGLAAWCGARAAGASRPAGWCAGTGVMLGLAMLVKPMFPLVVIGLLAIALLWMRKRRAAAWMLVALPVAVLVAAPWHIAMYLKHGDVFVSEFLGREVLQRASGARFNKTEHWHTVPRMILTTGLPWSALLIGVALEAFERRGITRSRAFKLGAVWVVVFIALLWMFGDKRSRYFMPVWPPAMIIAAGWVVRRSHEWAWLRGAIAPKRLAAAAPAMLGVSVALTAANVIPDQGPAPEWAKLYEFLRTHRHEDVWEVSLWHHYSGRIYLNTGIWPKSTTNWDDVEFRVAPAGALAITRPEHKYPVLPGDEIMFDEGGEKGLRVIRLGPVQRLK